MMGIKESRDMIKCKDSFISKPNGLQSLRSHSNKPVKEERKIESKEINKLNMRGQKREIF